MRKGDSNMRCFLLVLFFLVLFLNTAFSLSGGPDAFGYRWVDSRETGGPAFEWHDISTTGTLISTSGSDDGYSVVTLPRAFEYYGTPFTQMNVTTNGAISFGTISYFTYSPSGLPYNDGTNAVIAAMWADLYPSRETDYGIKTQGFDDKFIIQWNRVQEISYTANLQTFQIVLYYGSRTIMINYLDVTRLSARSAWIGIEDPTGTIGLLCGRFGTLDGEFLQDSLSIRFRATPSASPPYFNDMTSLDDFRLPEDGSSSGWEHGRPVSVGPSYAHSAPSCFGTNISGNYADDADWYLIAPDLDLTSSLRPFWIFGNGIR
jgi:hypothetical protein